MNEEKIYDMLVNTSLLMKDQPSPKQLEAYTKELVRFPLGKIKNALDKIKFKHKFFPSLSEIYELLEPEANEKDLANELAGQIIDCISSYGHARGDEVKQVVGEVGWFAVNNFGGWDILCRTEVDQLQTARAQLRDICSMALKLEAKNQLQLNYTERRESISKSSERIDFNKLLD